MEDAAPKLFFLSGQGVSSQKIKRLSRSNWVEPFRYVDKSVFPFLLSLLLNSKPGQPTTKHCVYILVFLNDLNYKYFML